MFTIRVMLKSLPGWIKWHIAAHVTALDDAVDEFPESCENLLLCAANIGFDDVVADRLKSVQEIIRPHPRLVKIHCARTFQSTC